MPVSTPSEFPPHRAGDQIIGLESGQNYVGSNCFLAGQSAGNNATITDCILIGHLAGSAGITDAKLDGTTVIGSTSLTALTTSAGNASPMTVVGSHIADALVNGDSSVLVGSNILTAYTGTGGSAALNACVFIGSNLSSVANGTTGATNNAVVIGHNVYQAAMGGATLANCVVLGGSVLQNVAADSSITNCVIIGSLTANNIQGTMSSCVIIGSDASSSQHGSFNVDIGAFSGQSAGDVAGKYNVCIGSPANSVGNYNVVIGCNAISSQLGANIGNVVIGNQAGQTLSPADTNVLVIETSTVDGGAGNPASALIFGNFLTGNVILGTSLQGTNRDLPTAADLTNVVKLLNNTVAVPTIVTPTGGGYFYVAAGALHWKGSGGSDTTLAPA